MAKFCPKCEKSLELSTITGELLFKCPVCQEQVKGNDMDVMMPANVHSIEESPELWRNTIINAPFDRVTTKVDIVCIKCKRDYLTRLVLGKNASIVYSCLCGYNSINDGMPVIKKQNKTEAKEIKNEEIIKGQAELSKSITDLSSTIEENKESIKSLYILQPQQEVQIDTNKIPSGIKFYEFNKYKIANEDRKNVQNKDPREYSPQDIRSSSDTTFVLQKLPHMRIVRIAAFDYDYTLFKPYSSEFARNDNDYILLRKTIPQVLKELTKDHLIVVFSNQSRNIDVATNRIKKSIEEYKLPVNYAFIAIQNEYRKPNTAMWNEMLKLLNITSVDKSNSFYCGDNYNGDDENFAKNIELTFKKPEDIFPLENPKVKTDGKLSVAITVGFPASGKSTMSKKVFPGFEVVSIDNLGTRPKALKEMEKLLASNKSVVFDATNPSSENRKLVTNIAKKYNAVTYIIYMNMSISQAKKFNDKREKVVPTIVYNTFASKFEMPTKDECDHLIIYDF